MALPQLTNTIDLSKVTYQTTEKGTTPGSDRLVIFAPTPEALQAEMNKYQGYSRAGRVDPSLTKTITSQQQNIYDPTTGAEIAGLRDAEPGAHGAGVYQEYINRLGGATPNYATTPLGGELAERATAVFQGPSVTSRPTPIVSPGATPAGIPSPTGTPTGTQTTTGTIKEGQNLSTIVQSLGITPQEFLKLNPQFAAKGNKGDWQGLTGLIQPNQTYVIPGKTAPAISSTGTGVPTTGITSPNLPNQTYQNTANTYYSSLSQQVTSAQQALEAERNTQLQKIQADKTAAQTELDSIRTQQQGAIDAIGTASMEEKQMILDRLKIEEARFDQNYNAVQGLTTQLMDLMTEGNNLIAMISGKTGLQNIRNPRINQAIQGVTAATGVIQAGISAYNGQMSQAQSQLINATNVITSAYTDQLEYYKTLVNFYESKAGDTSAKLTTLTKNERDFLDAKIIELENNVQRAQANSDYIQKLMISPETALFMAQAGITLNDSPEQVNYKLAEQSKRQQIIDTTNEYVKDGYTSVPFPQPGQTGLVTISVGGQTLSFKPPLSKDKPSGTETQKPLSIWEIGQIERLYGFIPPPGSTMGQVEQYVADNPGATPEELQAGVNTITGGASGGTSSEQFLNREYFQEQYTDEQLASFARKLGLVKTINLRTERYKLKTVLDWIDQKVTQARTEGYSDTEILSFIDQQLQ